LIRSCRLHEGIYKLSGDQPDIVFLLPQCSSQEVSTGAGFRADQRNLHVRGARQQLPLSGLLPDEHLAGRAECHEMERCLA
jgi:hypothetical protein